MLQSIFFLEPLGKDISPALRASVYAVTSALTDKGLTRILCGIGAGARSGSLSFQWTPVSPICNMVKLGWIQFKHWKCVEW